MNNDYYLTSSQKEELEKELRSLYKKEFSLRQNILLQKQQTIAEKEELFLELLEIFDALEFLSNYLQKNPELSPQFIKRLPKTVDNIQKKLLIILQKRQVNLIDFKESKPDFAVCQVIDCEIRNDVEEQSITKIIRRGFHFENKLLRPIEVIVAKPE